MASQDDSDRWIAEMEGEAGDATKLTADLNTGNAPFSRALTNGEDSP
jgi:hypothetical protein